MMNAKEMAEEIARLQAENQRLAAVAAAANGGRRVEAKMEGNTLVVRIPLHAPKLSTTGNSMVVGQATGMTGINVEGKGEIKVTVSAYLPLPKDQRVSRGNGTPATQSLALNERPAAAVTAAPTMQFGALKL